jgi:sulfonate transport system ATP-binding protein
LGRKPIGSHLQVKGVGKRFDNVEVLKRLDLEIKPGEFVAIVGRSGCGKSTLLRLLAGLDVPTEGEVLLDGERVNGIHPDTRILFQDARLLPWKRVIANVQIGARNGDKARAEEALRLVGLEHKAKEWPSVLSGGQRQRIALARALAGSPRLLLLDEPLSALDALTRIEMQELIERIWREQQFSAILVTHDVSEAVALADRIVLIKNGVIAIDIPVHLPRPRERNSDFAYYEKLILDHLMERGAPAAVLAVSP